MKIGEKNLEKKLARLLSKGYSVREISERMGVSIHTVYKFLHRFNIPLPSKRKECPYRNKEWLETMLNHHTIREIASQCNVWPSTILKWAHRFGLKAPPPKKPIKIELDSSFRELVDGLLLMGANCSFSPGKKSVAFQLIDEKEMFLQWLAKILRTEYKIPCKVEKRGKSYCLRTKRIATLVSLAERWKKRGKKIIPPDFVLTPRIALLWFLHRGHLEQYKLKKGTKRYSKAIRLWVYRFDSKSRKRLILELEKIGIQGVSIYEGQNFAMIRIPSSESQKFLEFIGECPLELEQLFSYKWEALKGR